MSLDDRYISLSWNLARELNSADKAIILNMIQVSIFYKETNDKYDPASSKYFMDGVWWMQDSFDSWQKRMPWVCLRTLKTYFADLYAKGYLEKKIVTKRGGGREGTFYRVASTYPKSRKCKNDIFDESAASAQPSCKPYTFQESANSALSSISTYNQADNQTKKAVFSKSTAKAKITTWEPSDPFADIFTNLTLISSCKASFDVPTYTSWLTGLMQEESLTISELTKLSNAWQEYHNGRTQQPKVAKSSFRTWCTNYTSRRVRNEQSKPTYQKPQAERLGESGYDCGDLSFITKSARSHIV